MKSISRRDLRVLLPALAAMNVDAQQQPAGGVAPLTSKVYQNSAVPYRGAGEKKGRRFFFGTNRSSFALEMHETILPAGTETHPPHKHPHEEIVIVMDGTLDVYIEGKIEKAEAGSVAYIATNEMHNMKSAGSGPARYCVIELRATAS